VTIFGVSIKNSVWCIRKLGLTQKTRFLTKIIAVEEGRGKKEEGIRKRE
jgi:hypothetical protein